MYEEGILKPSLNKRYRIIATFDSFGPLRLLSHYTTTTTTSTTFVSLQFRWQSANTVLKGREKHKTKANATSQIWFLWIGSSILIKKEILIREEIRQVESERPRKARHL